MSMQSAIASCAGKHSSATNSSLEKTDSETWQQQHDFSCQQAQVKHVSALL